MLKSKADICSGIAFLAISGVFYLQHTGTEGVSYAFPIFLIGFIGVGGIYYLIRGILNYSKEAGLPSNEVIHWGNVGWVSLMAFLYAIGIPILGYWLCTGLFLAITYIGLVYKKNSLKKSLYIALLFGCGFSFLVWLGFVKLMGVPTPTGVLW